MRAAIAPASTAVATCDSAAQAARTWCVRRGDWIFPLLAFVAPTLAEAFLCAGSSGARGLRGISPLEGHQGWSAIKLWPDVIAKSGQSVAARGARARQVDLQRGAGQLPSGVGEGRLRSRVERRLRGRKRMLAGGATRMVILRIHKTDLRRIGVAGVCVVESLAQVFRLGEQ